MAGIKKRGWRESIRWKKGVGGASVAGRARSRRRGVGVEVE